MLKYYSDGKATKSAIIAKNKAIIGVDDTLIGFLGRNAIDCTFLVEVLLIIW